MLWGTNKCCSNRSHLQEFFNCSSLLACKAQRVQIPICFPTSSSGIHLTRSASCRLLSRHSAGTSWEFSLKQLGISPTYQVTYLLRGRMKVLHLISMRPKECWLATLNASSAILSHALEQINAARIGVLKLEVAKVCTFYSASSA